MSMYASKFEQMVTRYEKDEAYRNMVDILLPMVSLHGMPEVMQAIKLSYFLVVKKRVEDKKKGGEQKNESNGKRSNGRRKRAGVPVPAGDRKEGEKAETASGK